MIIYCDRVDEWKWENVVRLMVTSMKAFDAFICQDFISVDMEVMTSECRTFGRLIN